MRLLTRVVTVLLLTLALAAPDAGAWVRLPAVTFAALPPGATNPEGITADRHGNPYVKTPAGAAGVPAPPATCAALPGAETTHGAIPANRPATLYFPPSAAGGTPSGL